MKTAALILEEKNNSRNKTPTRSGERKKKKQQQEGLTVYVQNKQTDRRGTETQASSASRHEEAMKPRSSDSLEEEIKKIPEKPTG